MWELVKNGKFLYITDGKDEYKVGWSNREEMVRWGISEVDRRNGSSERLVDFVFGDEVLRFFLDLGMIYSYRFLKSRNLLHMYRSRRHDILSEVGIVISKTIRTFIPGRSTYAHYLLTCIRRAIGDLVERKMRKDWREIPVEIYDELLENTSWCSILREDDRFPNLDHQSIESLLRRLSPRMGELFRLRYYENKSYSEIAEILGISKQRVYQLWCKLNTSNAWLATMD